MQAGTVVLIIGTSSVGKSSTLRELQQIVPEHYLALGIDTFFHMVSPRWGGGMGGPLSVEGFRYVSTVVAGAPTMRIAYGEVGRRVLDGMHRAVAALALAGNNVFVDEMLLDASVLADWAAVLQGLPVCIVWLHAALATIEQREHQRGNRPGLSRGHLPDNTLERYDLAIDTTERTPSQVAQAIAVYLASGAPWTALDQLYQQRKCVE